MSITSSGYETTPVENILSEVQELFKNSLGEDLSLDPETPQGNMINMITSLLHQIDLHRQSDFYARDVYHAQGLQLDILGRELGLPRKLSVPTQVYVELKGAINYVVPAGTQANIITNNSQIFEFPTAVSITSTAQQVTLQAINGAVYEDIAVGQQLQTQEYTPQIYDMKILSIVYGQPQESDYQYRLRLIEAKSANVDEVAHLTLALENINNVLSAYVDPNNSLITSPTGIPPHAVEIVVLGGAESDIGNVLMGYLFATPTYEDPTLGEAIQVVDYNGNIQTFYITRPQQLSVSVTINYSNKQGQTLSVDNKSAIESKIKQLINSTYMNKTLYKSDVCNIATEGYNQYYAINELEISVEGVTMDAAYECGSRQYLYADTVTFEEA